MPTGFSVGNGNKTFDRHVDFEDADAVDGGVGFSFGTTCAGFFRADNGLLKTAEVDFRGELVLTCTPELLATNTCRCKLPGCSGTP